MSSNPRTPDASSPTHTTYQVDVPVRDARSNPPNNPEEQEWSPPDIQIPKITPISSGPPPAELAVGLEGKYVDEFGNILDWDGTVLGRVNGDLPSMVGRSVTASGEVLGLDGQVVGHVCENYSKPNLRPLGGGLQVDDEGNIYDENGDVVGKLNSSVKGFEGDQGKKTNRSQGRPDTSPAPRPDEIYLDVKSTFDGIQLVIKIPTVFNRERSNRT